MTAGNKELRLGALREALASGTLRPAQRMVAAMHPAEVASMLESLPPRQRELVWEFVDKEIEGDVLVELNENVRNELIEEMETALGLPTGELVATMARYNEHSATGQDPDFGKHPDWLAPQTEGPWGVFDLSLGVALYAGFTLGGISVTLDGEARRTDGTVIPGLYAAGACASNIAQDGNSYCSGTQLGEGSFFGRRAGRHAAAREIGRAHV